MALKLGELLLQKKMITEAQLLDALEAQVVFGSRLGTNLIELGFINEDTLASVISQQLNVPFVKPERLRNIPRHILKLIPRDLVEKHRVLPLGADGTVVRLGMSPPDPEAIEEISRATGLSIVPFVVTEIRLTEALQKYYGIQMDPRLTGVTEQLDSLREKRLQSISPDPRNVLLLARKEFKGAKNRDDVANITIDSSLVLLKRVALFLNKGSYIQGWTGRGMNLKREDVRKVEIPFNVPSIFRTVAQSEKTLFGTIPDEPFTIRVLTIMGKVRPHSIALSPVSIRGRILIFLYGDKGIEGDVGEQERSFLESLAQEAGHTFDRLIFSARR